MSQNKTILLENLFMTDIDDEKAGYLVASLERLGIGAISEVSVEPTTYKDPDYVPSIDVYDVSLTDDSGNHFATTVNAQGWASFVVKSNGEAITSDYAGPPDA